MGKRSRRKSELESPSAKPDPTIGRGKLVAKTVLLFASTYGALMTVDFLWGAETVERHMNNWTASTAAWALFLLGAHGRADANVVQSSLTTFNVISECTALYPAVIFVSAVVAFPASLAQKLWAMLGIPILVIVNLIRIVSLCFINRWFPSALDTAHFVVWQSLMVFVTVLLWLLWATRLASPHDRRTA